MQRRKFLVGIGSLAAGGAAAMGTSAFAVDAQDRDASGTIVRDDNAYLKLKANSPYSNIGTGDSDDELNVTLQRLNSDATTQLDDVFFIQNSGTGPVDVSVDDLSNVPSDVTVEDVFVTSGDAPNGNSILGSNSVNLAVGDEIGVGVTVTVKQKLPAGASNSFTFSVDADAA